MRVEGDRHPSLRRLRACGHAVIENLLHLALAPIGGVRFGWIFEQTEPGGRVANLDINDIDVAKRTARMAELGEVGLQRPAKKVVAIGESDDRDRKGSFRPLARASTRSAPVDSRLAPG